MPTKFEKVIKALAIAPLLALSFGTAHAYDIVKGQVDLVRTHDGVAEAAWQPPMFWFTLKGVSSFVGCPTWGVTRPAVMFVARDKQELTFILTAAATGMEVSVAVDPRTLVNGYCLARFVTVGTSVPAE